MKVCHAKKTFLGLSDAITDIQGYFCLCQPPSLAWIPMDSLDDPLKEFFEYLTDRTLSHGMP
jgi:hypothetical protein